MTLHQQTAQYTGAFAERNCVLVLGQGNLVTAVSLDVSGNNAADVSRQADAPVRGLAEAPSRS